MRQLWSLFLVLFLNGICLGFYEAGANMFLLQLWGLKASPFTQAVYLMFGSGNLIAPQLIEPFLLIDEPFAEGMEHEATTTELYYNASESKNETKYTPDDVELYIPYSILGIIALLNFVGFLVAWKISPQTEDHPSRAEAHPEQEASEDADEMEKEKGKKFWRIVVVILSLVFMHIYFGFEVSFGSFIMAYDVHSDLKLSKTIGAHMTTVYWAMFTFTRISAMLVVGKWGCEIVILISLVVTLLSAGVLFPFGNTDVNALWAGIVLVGMGTSSIWACMFGYLEGYFPVTSIIASLLVVFGVLGECVFPVIISHFIESYPQILLSVVLFCSISITSIFLIIVTICRCKLKRRTKVTIKTLSSHM